MTPLEAARGYARAGLRVVPIPHRSKRPAVHGWQDLRLGIDDLPTHFNGAPRNIGILLGEPSGGVVDVDLDAPEARAIAHMYLPPTGRISGRASARASHLWYKGDPLTQTERFIDPTQANSDERACIVELRSTGAQTIVPPSDHPTGEPITWERADRAAAVDGRVLHRQVARLAAAVVVARHWPATGARHDAALALAGWLLRAGWQPEDVEHLLDAITTAAGDDEPADRVACVATTKAAIDAGAPATGYRRLTELMDRRVLVRASQWLELPRHDAGGEQAPPEAKRERKSQATLLVDLVEAEGSSEFFHSPDGEALATVRVREHHETWLVKSRGFRRWLQRRYFEAFGTAASAQGIQDAIGVFEGRASFEGHAYPVYTRVAAHDGEIELDLGDESWSAVRVTRNGWAIVATPQAKFRRTKGMAALPRPVRGVTLAALDACVNIDNAGDLGLLKTWLVAALWPTGPYPLLVLSGEQGTAKSFLARVLFACTDPRSAPLRGAPRDERDLMIAASNGWTLGYDNISRIPNWFSDALCRLATGGGLATRELYSDTDETIFDVTRPVVLTAIEHVVTASDLSDRAMSLVLPKIDDEKRRTEKALWCAFEAVRPRILGALLDALSRGLRDVDQPTTARLPRLADFARLALAVAPSVGWTAEAFIDSYDAKRKSAHADVLDGVPWLPQLRKLNLPWIGTATELQRTICAGHEFSAQDGWPRSASAMSGALRRLAPNLRATGMDVHYGRTGDTRTIRLERMDTVPSPTVTPSPPDGEPVTTMTSGDDDDGEAPPPSRHTFSPGDDGVTARDGVLHHASHNGHEPTDPVATAPADDLDVFDL